MRITRPCVKCNESKPKTPIAPALLLSVLRTYDLEKGAAHTSLAHLYDRCTRHPSELYPPPRSGYRASICKVPHLVAPVTMKFAEQKECGQGIDMSDTPRNLASELGGTWRMTHGGSAHLVSILFVDLVRERYYDVLCKISRLDAHCIFEVGEDEHPVLLPVLLCASSPARPAPDTALSTALRFSALLSL